MLGNRDNAVGYGGLHELDDAMVVELTVELTTKDAKKSKIKNIDVVIRNICALLNEKGGTLRIILNKTSQENISRKLVTDFIRTTEQRMSEITDYSNVGAMETKICYPHYIAFAIKPSPSLCTMNYNLCIPTETQLISLPATTPVSNVKEIMARKYLPENYVKNGIHCRDFVWKNRVIFELRESKEVQFKIFKAESSKCVSLADRIVSRSNKLVHQVSAFANHKGGHLYIGIDSSTYLVEGILVSETEKYKIRAKVGKTLSKMIWPEHIGIPQRGQQWDIYFEQVNDSKGQPIPHTHVIVIHVAPCPGGVFLDQPESYHAVDGKIQRMSLDVWRDKILSSRYTDVHQIIRPEKIIGITDSKSERNHFILFEYLERLRKEGDWKKFEAISSKELKLDAKTDAAVVAYHVTLAAKMKKEYSKAYKNLTIFLESKKYTANPSNFDVHEIHLNVIFLRSKGLNDASYNLAKDGLEKVDLLEDTWMKARFYMLFASLAAIRATEVTNSRERHKEEAEEHNQKALRILEKLSGNATAVADLQRTTYINMALLSLGSSIKGLNDDGALCQSQIETAQGYLTFADRLFLGARQTTEYNMCKILFARSDLQYRLSQIYPRYSLVHLKTAFAIAEEARNLTKKNKFLELFEYGLARLAFLTEKVIYQRLHTRKTDSKQEYIYFED